MATPPSTERLFVAVPLSDEARVALAARLPASLPGRPVAPPLSHLILRFVGATTPARRDAIVAQLRDADLGPAFRVRLGRLAAAVERAVVAAGCAPETRPFAAHLTLARLAPPRSVAELLAAAAGGPLGAGVELPVDAAVLFRSRLGQGTPRYEVLARVPLGHAPAAGPT